MSKRAVQLLIAALVVMTLLNITMVAVVWTRMAGDPAPGNGTASSFPNASVAQGEWRERGGEARQRMLGRLLSNQLGLDEAQMEQFREVREQQMEKTRELQRTLRAQRMALMADLPVLEPTDLAEDPRLFAIRETTAELERLNLEHLLRLRAICREEQLERFDRLMPRLLFGGGQPRAGEGFGPPAPG